MTLTETGTKEIPETAKTQDQKITAPEGARHLGD